MEHAREALEEIVSRVNGVFETRVSTFREALDEAGFTLFPQEPPLTVPGGSP